ncbi:MAG: hypothetical protein GWN25_08150, partial [Actinobacteria bacterium]|nr:hypothetical protein [Actinomycetota bacterium]NIW27193.1 hypothetical protein [Actinomycetota bacterium]
MLPMVGGEEARGLIQSGFNESGGKFSPDGAWLAYNSDESGRAEVFVVPFPGPGRKWQISTAGGRVIAWKDDGTEIYYQDPGGQILAAEVGVRGETFLVGQVDTLFTGPPMAVDMNIDVS